MARYKGYAALHRDHTFITTIEGLAGKKRSSQLTGLFQFLGEELTQQLRRVGRVLCEGPRGAAAAQVAADALTRGTVEMVGQQVVREAPSVDVGLHGHAGELAQGTVNVDQLDETVVPPPAPARRPPPVAYYERDARGELGVGLLAPVAMLAQMPA